MVGGAVRDGRGSLVRDRSQGRGVRGGGGGSREGREI